MTAAQVNGDAARMKLPLVQHRSVFITGCSTGIGRATARVLRDRGWRVFAGARKPADLNALAAEGFDPINMDLMDSTRVHSAASQVLKESGGQLGALVNNAGFGQPGALEDLSRDQLRRQFEVNVFGLQELTNLVLPAMLRTGSGRIVHISSVLGRVTIPRVGAYCASKHAVESLADAQRVELRGTGIGLSLIEPGPIRSEFRNTSAAIRKSEMPANTRIALPDRSANNDGSAIFTQGPEAVASKIVHALESARPKRRYKVTFPAYAAPLARSLLPESFFDWVVARRLDRKLD
ncbi:MAG: SDR family NAD(P)-dependent oxidoreductase [Kiritimatiellae bacterium]|nr:SDR family NAD(P)-dependent oxidoreductase [Kiritimatiellia bacterium]